MSKSLGRLRQEEVADAAAHEIGDVIVLPQAIENLQCVRVDVAARDRVLGARDDPRLSHRGHCTKTHGAKRASACVFRSLVGLSHVLPIARWPPAVRRQRSGRGFLRLPGAWSGRPLRPSRETRSNGRGSCTTSGNTPRRFRRPRKRARTPARADSANLIAARAFLERYRESAASEDLTNARDRLRTLNTEGFSPTERVEYVIGLGETLFFDGLPGAAAAIFGAVVAGPDFLTPAARDGLLDWWASAIDRDARRQPDIERRTIYQRILDRMEVELGANPGSAAASYWLAAGAWGQGDLSGRVGCRARRMGPGRIDVRSERRSARRPRSPDAARHHPRARESDGAASRHRARRVGALQGALEQVVRTLGSASSHVRLVLRLFPVFADPDVDDQGNLQRRGALHRVLDDRGDCISPWPRALRTTARRGR